MKPVTPLKPALLHLAGGLNWSYVTSVIVGFSPQERNTYNTGSHRSYVHVTLRTLGETNPSIFLSVLVTLQTGYDR